MIYSANRTSLKILSILVEEWLHEYQFAIVVYGKEQQSDPIGECR